MLLPSFRLNDRVVGFDPQTPKSELSCTVLHAITAHCCFRLNDRNTVPKARYTNATDQTVNTECPVNTGNSLRFLSICWYSCFIYRWDVVFRNCSSRGPDYLGAYKRLETVAKRDAILTPVPKQCRAKNTPSYGIQSKCAKTANHW